MRTSIATMGIISTLLGLVGVATGSAAKAAEPKRALAGPPEVTSETEEGSHDLLLFVEKHEVLPGDAQSIWISDVHRGKRVALEIVLGPAWRAGSLSLGMTSRALLRSCTR